MSEKRILITKVSGECRNLRIQQDPFDDKPGTYCAAYIHGGWEKIDPKKCETCKREKYIPGISRQEAIEKMAKAIYEAMCPNFSQMFVGWRAYTKIAEAALDELLGKESV